MNRATARFILRLGGAGLKGRTRLLTLPLPGICLREPRAPGVLWHSLQAVLFAVRQNGNGMWGARLVKSSRE